MRRSLLWPAVVLPTLLQACASTPSTTSPSDTPPQTSPPVAHALPAATWTTTSFGDDLQVHTLMGPEEVLAVTSHVVETSGHLVVIDTQLTTPHAQQLVAKVKQLQKPLARVVVSHGHPDHYFGVGEVEQLGVAVEALPAARAHMRRRFKAHHAGHKKMEGDAIPDVIRLPSADVELGAFTLDGVDFVVEEIGRAEDVEQLIVWLPQHKALIAQDLVSNGYHAFFGTGRVDGWRGILDELAARQPNAVFAGHGPVGDASLLTSTSSYLAQAQDLADAATSQQGLVDAVFAAFPERKGPFLVEISAVILFRDRARAQQPLATGAQQAP